jgi:hypothetical protein
MAAPVQAAAPVFLIEIKVVGRGWHQARPSGGRASMFAMRLKAIRSNIERLQECLDGEADEARRAELEDLLAAATAEASLLEEEMRLVRGEAGWPADADRWRLRALEYLALGRAAHGDGADRAYRRLAAGYASMAERAEKRRRGGAAA